MTFKQYQKKALMTATYDNPKKGILCSVLGLMGEFTEFIENPVPHELGDVWWYLAALTHYLGIEPRRIDSEKYRKANVPSTIGKIQEIIKKSYRDNDLEYFNPDHMSKLHILFNELYTRLYYWSMTVVSNTSAEPCAEIIWELNIVKLQDRQERNVLHGSGDER